MSPLPGRLNEFAQRPRHGDLARDHDLLVDHERGGLHDPVCGDLGVVGHLGDGGVSPEFSESLMGALLECGAVAAAGAENLDVIWPGFSSDRFVRYRMSSGTGSVSA